LQASVSKGKNMDTCSILQQTHCIAWNVQVQVMETQSLQARKTQKTIQLANAVEQV